MQPDERVARRDARRRGPSPDAARSEDDRAARPTRGGASPRRRAARERAALRARSATITAKRLLLAPLPLAQPATAAEEVASHGEVETAQPLDGQDAVPRATAPAAVASGSRRRARRPLGPAAEAAARTPGTRSAGRGSGGRQGSRTRAAVARTSGSGAMRGLRAVVGHVARRCVKRGPQFGAVGEGIAVAPVAGLADLAQALGAGREVGRDRDAPACRRAALARSRRPAPARAGMTRAAASSHADGGRRLPPRRRRNASSALRRPERLDRHALRRRCATRPRDRPRRGRGGRRRAGSRRPAPCRRSCDQRGASEGPVAGIATISRAHQPRRRAAPPGSPRGRGLRRAGSSRPSIA